MLMFRIISFTFLLRNIAVVTTALSILAYVIAQQFMESELPIIRTLSVAPWVVLIVTMFITTNTTSRFIWRVLTKFNPSLYPDLNGTWEGEITMENGDTLPARALIRQNLIHAQIDLHTKTSKSVTLEATPAIEGGQLKLYHTFRSTPKHPGWHTYTGSTVFDVRTKSQNSVRKLELSGYYYTDRRTVGRIRLEQVSDDPNADVSYY